IKKLFNDLKSFTFWDRLFRWNAVKTLLIDASGDLQKLLIGSDSVSRLNHELEIERNKNKSLESSLSDLKILRAEKDSLLTEKTTLESKNDNFLKRGTELATELSAVKQKLESRENEMNYLREEITKYKSAEEERKRQHEHSINNLNVIVTRTQQERNKEKEEQHQREIDRLLRQKQTWSNHEVNVKGKMKTICNRHGVEYLEIVPFKGKPDNTLKINDEFVIFDAKSPLNEDLNNFPIYIRNQAESVSKYVKEEGVRREIFLVVPTNTLEALEQFEFRLSDYTVYVISTEALEPIILALRKIEDYEFAESLSPEERENICRVIGKFVHLSKRRIQIDGFFAKQFFELVYRSEADLPKDILEKAVEFERNEKLNPPTDKRAKQISNRELEAEATKTLSDASQRGIYTDESHISKNLNKTPLYSEATKEEKKDQPELF
ncbi:MAG TPA: hypothetical protein VGK39_04665, partial [Cyclobacteriaceae bacterium]